MLAISRRLFPVLNAARTSSLTSITRNNRTASTKPQPTLSEAERTIFEKLTDKFAPSQLQVQDVSGGCGTFYAIVIASNKFQGLPMVKQHRLVTDTLKSEIEGIHGLQIKTIAH